MLSDAKPVLGVIYDFNNDELYEGSINTSACLNGQAITVSTTKISQEGILVTGLPNDTDYSDEALMEMIKNFQNWRKVRMIGSAGCLKTIQDYSQAYLPYLPLKKVYSILFYLPPNVLP